MLRFIPLHIFLFLFLILTASWTEGQTGSGKQTPPATGKPTTDTLKTIPQPAKSDLEGPVKYKADRIAFSVKARKTYLLGNVHIEYQNITLDAGQVTIDWDRSYMTAIGSVDSTDSLGNTVKTSPAVFSERGNEPIHGKRLEYDFKNQRGKVLIGTTKMNPGYYKGEEIKKVGKNTLFVKDGYFTTCDSIDHPHFYFKASKMRIKVGKRAVAKPIVMYIADVPVMAIPFGVFPMESGRRSGLIIPTYEKSSYGGNSLRHLGYYWAASQYWDATVLANFYEKTGTAYEGELRYKKRYAFSGNVNGRFAPRDITTGEKRTRWSLNFHHNQTISETMNLNASGSFVSDKNFLQNTSHRLSDRLNQVLTTNVTLSKRWPSSKNAITANVSRTENLQNGNLDYTLPRLSFSHTQSSIFSFDPKKSTRKKWYHDIYYRYNSNFLSRGSRKSTSDTLEIFRRESSSAWQHTATLSFNSKLFKYFKYRQSVNFEELWVPEYREYHWVDSLNNAVADTVKGFRPRHTFSSSVGASTTIYGLFELPFSPLKIIRHKMDPSVSFSFSPDFTTENWGYVQTFRDTLGRIRKFDRFTGNPYGGTRSSEARRMNISVNNLFQGKIIRDGEEKKIDLFNLNFSTSYDFIRDSLKWNDLTSRMQARASRDFDFTFSATHSFYKYGHQGSRRRNEYVWQNGFALPRLVRLQANARVHLSPRTKKQTPKPATEPVEGEPESEQPDITKNPLEERLKNFKLPWDLSANFTYSLDRSVRNSVRKRFDANVSGRIELTRNWRVQYSANFDLINKEITHQTFNIYRDLHCWEMSFSWSPSPAYSYFNLEIRVKESMLQDIKLTKTSGGRRAF
ncbi:MAG TPA: LPS-assembly protein LptD [Caldithrix sp.]|nr:LPS-assembly protein LptD [Caldithrix sp.]